MDMLREKVFIKSAAYPFSKNFPFGQTNGVCRVCKKTFCCVKCRDRHMDTTHPNVNTDCALCVSEILPMRQYEFAKLSLEDEKVLCHIVDKHLPLRCRLCGDLFKSKEDFKSIATCKWYERWHCLTSPIGHENLEKTQKSCSISGSYSSSKFCTSPGIYRKTSTPMFVGQKAGFETLCVPEFSFKTPNSSSIAQIASISKTQNDTQFFSFLLTSNEDLTPFKTSKNKQVPRYNSSSKLSITEEEEKTANEKAEKITAGAIKMSSFVDMIDMELTPPKGGILQASPKSDDVCEDTEGVVKKVRFSDQYNTAEFEDLMNSCARVSLNKSEKFHDAHDEMNVQEAKTTTEDIKSVGNTVDTDKMKDMCIVEDARSTNDGQAEGRRRSLIQTSTPLNDSQIRIICDSMKNGIKIKKENQEPGVSGEGASTANQRDSNRVLMMVLMESNSGGLTNDLMPLISSGLKKLQEQLISANCQSASSAPEPAKVHRRSITTMKMSATSVETYSTDSAAVMTNHGQIASSSSSSSSVQSGENGNRFLSAIAQAMKHAMRSLAVSGLKIPPRRIEESKVTQEVKIIEELTSSQESSSGASNRPARSGKRTREVTEESSKEDPMAIALDAGSPLVKRQRGWYKMVKGRQPISRMRNSCVTTSPRGVSAETQVFSQGSLTVGDTVLPLPARAHQSTE